MILPVILQEGNITNTDWEQSHYAELGFAFLRCVVLFIVFFGGKRSIPNKVYANLKFIRYIYGKQI